MMCVKQHATAPLCRVKTRPSFVLEDDSTPDAHDRESSRNASYAKLLTRHFSENNIMHMMRIPDTFNQMAKRNNSNPIKGMRAWGNRLQASGRPAFSRRVNLKGGVKRGEMQAASESNAET